MEGTETVEVGVAEVTEWKTGCFLQCLLCSFTHILWKYLLQVAQAVGADLVLKTLLHNRQVLEAGVTVCSRFLAASLKVLISYFFAFAMSLNLLIITLLRNQSAAILESGMTLLPWIWTVLLE